VRYPTSALLSLKGNYNVAEHENLKLILAILILIGRIGDIGSTYLVSPGLHLESNPVMKRLRWPFACLTLLVCALPYWSIGTGIVVLVASLLVSASNSTKIWLARAMGEEEYLALLMRMAARAKPVPSLVFSLLPALFMAILALTVMYLYPNPDTDLGYYVGLGILGYALVVAIYGPTTFLRYRKAAHAG
jgi:hypothetical protein